jgi:hypothetical protein
VDIRNANGSSASSPRGVGIRGFAGSTQIIREGAYKGGAASGFRILPSTGTLTAGSVFVYGFKNS